MARRQAPTILTAGPKQFSENSLLETRTPLTIQPEILARNASDISHAQVIVLSQKANANAVDETSRPKNTTDDATAVIDNHLITKDSQTM